MMKTADCLERRNLRLFQLPENKEDFRLIWLDSNIDESADSCQIQEMLQELNPTVQFYTDTSLCVDLIETIQDEQILLIVSGVLAQETLRKVHSVRSLCRVFVFCVDRECYVSLLDEYTKIVGIFVNQYSLLLSIRTTMRLMEKKTFEFNIFSQKQISTRNLTKDSAIFLWHQLLIDVLREMSQDERAKAEMLERCCDYYQRSPCELAKIDEFRQHYVRDDAIKWYTADTFLYRLLNRAFRIEDMELIYSFRFFIIDLCANLEREHEMFKNECGLTVYRGQQLSKDEFENLKKNLGGLISINGFFSTTRDRNTALIFAGTSSEDATAVMFQIQVDSSCKSVAFADISKVSTFEGENEVLFSLGSTFKIDSIHYDEANKLHVVRMSCTDEGLEAANIRKKKEKELHDYSPMVYFGRLIREGLGQADRSKKYLDTLLTTLPPNHPDIASVYNEIGAAHMAKGELNLALTYYERSYKLRREVLSHQHPHLGVSLNNMGVIYCQKGEYDRAIDLYKEAARIYTKCYAGVHFRKAMLMRNFGLTYTSVGDYDVALDYLSQALTMYKAVLSDEDFFIADCLGYIGDVYRKKQNLNIALDYYQQRLKMKEHCLAADHPHLMEDLYPIVETYLEMQQPDEALKLCHEQLASQQESLGKNHSRIVHTLTLIGNIYRNKEEFQQALNFYLRALSTAESIRPLCYKSIIASLGEIGAYYYFRAMYNESLPYWHRQLELMRKIYPMENAHAAKSLKFIGNIHFKLGEHTRALTYLQEALTIYEKAYSRHHEDVKQLLIDINSVETTFKKTEVTVLDSYT